MGMTLEIFSSAEQAREYIKNKGLEKTGRVWIRESKTRDGNPLFRVNVSNSAYKTIIKKNHGRP